MDERQRNFLIAFAVTMLLILPLFSWMLAAMVGG